MTRLMGADKPEGVEAHFGGLDSVTIRCANDWNEKLILEPSRLNNCVVLHAGDADIHLDEARIEALIEALPLLLETRRKQR